MVAVRVVEAADPWYNPMGFLRHPVVSSNMVSDAILMVAGLNHTHILIPSLAGMFGILYDCEFVKSAVPVAFT